VNCGGPSIVSLFPHSGASPQFIFVDEERSAEVSGGEYFSECGVVFSGFIVISDCSHSGRVGIMVWILVRIETDECIRQIKRGT
jgi:hypothetical protein